MHVAYIASRYPDVSHTFIQREIVALRGLGLEISTFSVRRARLEQVLSGLDREEASRTYAILPPRPRDHLRAHRLALSRHPLAYAACLLRSLRRAALGARALLWRCFYFAEAVVLWDQCARRGINHVHAHFANVGSDVAELAAGLSRATGGSLGWSFTMHGSTEFYDVPGHRLADKVRGADFVVCVSDFTRSQLMMWVEDEHWDKLRVVHCAVDTAAFSPRSGRRHGGPLRILCVSRLVLGKGITLLFEAMATLAAAGVESELTLVGDGPERARLEGRAAELGVRVRFTGAVGQDEIRQHYAQADVFCLPSFAEGVPVVLMEAMASGLPVVATRITGVPELVDDGTSGLLVRPARADELVSALRDLARDPNRREAMGAAARDAVVEHYDLQRNAPRLAALFGERATEHSPLAQREPRAFAAGSPR
jgi:glycosyltransferase involved in cell wall biosynthesis